MFVEHTYHFTNETIKNRRRINEPPLEAGQSFYEGSIGSLS